MGVVLFLICFSMFFCFFRPLLARTPFGPDRLLAPSFDQTVVCPNLCQPSLTRPMELLFGTLCCSCLVFLGHGLPCEGPPLPKTTPVCCVVVWCVGAVCVQNFRGCVQDLGALPDLSPPPHPLSRVPLRRTPSPDSSPSRRTSPPPVRPKFRSFFPSPATIFILSSSLGGRFVEFWWCD